jgi:hypothetical protein
LLHVKAVPLLQPDWVLISIGVNPSIAHVCTGFVTEAFPAQAQLGLQQSQYRVVVPLPLLRLLDDIVVELTVLFADEDEELDDPGVGVHW